MDRFVRIGIGIGTFGAGVNFDTDVFLGEYGTMPRRKCDRR
jgi:hypothetical protein